MKIYNNWYADNQILYLNKVLNLLQKQELLNESFIQNSLKYQIQNAILWCNKYNIVINKYCKYLQKNYSFNSSTLFFTNSS
jgi:hypothetical protein